MHSGRVQQRADDIQRADDLLVAAAPTTALPDVGASRPRIIRIVVVFPAPLGPKNPVTCPGRTVKLRASTAVTGPKRLVNWSTSITTGLAGTRWASSGPLAAIPACPAAGAFHGMLAAGRAFPKIR